MIVDLQIIKEISVESAFENLRCALDSLNDDSSKWFMLKAG